MLADDHMVMQAVWGNELKAGRHVSTWAQKTRWHIST